ncbi:MAG TPA: DUF6515 family protein [Ferruginibacter sp.]|nr:DUF6515 family protein [Ferruginibacter sp.]
MKNMKFFPLMMFALLLTLGSFAQHGRGNYYNRGYNKQYRSGGYYSPRYNYGSVRVVPRYNYSSYYRPYYRPTYRPVYRPVYRPIYRSPRAYVHFGPTFGVRINVLPYGYHRIYVGSDPYYYNEGVYYRPYANNQYEVVAPPLGASVNKLPSNATVTVVDGQQYYQVGGTFYQQEVDENGNLSYRVVGTDGVLNTMEDGTSGSSDESRTEEVNPDQNQNTYDAPAPQLVAPPLGTRYDSLPADSKVLVINEQKYFLSPSGVYYVEVIEDDRIMYEVTNVK